MICTSVCLPIGLAETNKIIFTFALFFRLFGLFESLVFFTKMGGTNLAPKQSDTMFSVNFSKVQQHLASNSIEKSTAILTTCET